MTQRSHQKTDVNLYKDRVEGELFKLLTYQAEAAVAQKDFHTASARIQRCKDMLLRRPKQAAYLSVLCYNFGVDTYEDKLYEQSSFWLSQSYEIGKTDTLYSTGHEMQAKVLRLLATVYLEWDCKLHQDKALNAIRLANKEHLHPAGLFLKMKILLNGSLPDNVISMAAAEMLRHDLSLDVYLSTVKLLIQHERDCVGFDFLKMVCTHFESTPDNEKVLLLQIELLAKRGKGLMARQKVEDLITGHYSGKPLSSKTLNDLHVILWDFAAKSFERKSYSEAMEWYNYSLGIYASDCTETSFAKLQRNRASCFLHLDELSQAREAVTAAEKCDPDNILTHFILFKIAVRGNNELDALNAVTAMGKMATQTDSMTPIMDQYYSSTDLLSMAAQIALENNQPKIVVKALECVIEHSQDTQQVFISLRDHDTEILMSYLDIAHKKLAEPLAWNGLQDKHIDEAHWFRKIAWNLAVRAKESPLLMRDCFLLSYKISLFCPCDKIVLVAQRSCLLMAAALDLELARKAADHSEQVQLLVHSLENINLCREIWNNLKSAGEFSNDDTETLLVLYEFEVRAKLNDPALESVLQYVWELPNVNAKTMESIASLSMEAPAYYPSICKKALQGAFSLLRKQDSLDVSRISKCLHSLVKLSLPEMLQELEDCAQEEAWNYYQEALCIISTGEDYPETETLWLMTRAWNTGIFQYSAKRFPDAGRWCALAMRLLDYLGSLRKSYESKMTELYSHIQDKLDKGAARGQ
ncbi:PREDICTED: testis-expressed sequence 11 protein [Nanorana parkeri]|uniref:testis-expressed sequence 11 protein n=1 Tax=Nanorana parkeri TaxID=125878 RepID=UPI00085493BC|nr:PREDICTED: testis-expressed sequence 11 protein [Nanorana parkeri]